MMPVVRRPTSDPPVSWQPERPALERDTRPDFPVPGVPWRARARALLDRCLAVVGLQVRR